MAPTPESRKTVAVRPAAALATRPRLRAALEAAFAVRLVPWAAGGPAPDAVLVVAEGGVLPPVAELASAAVPVLAVCDAVPGGAEAPRRAVALADSPAIEPTLHGITLHDRLVGPALAVDRGREDVLAVAEDGPAWTRTRTSDAPVHRVRSVLPELAEDEVLYALLSRRAIAAVALVHLLRALGGEEAWHRPPLRATFVFDDPNLRWRSYGFLDYRRLVAHANEHGYHVAMAMIPLDAGRPHRATAELFARRHDRLSLVVHGNDHVRHELLYAEDPAVALSTAAQALRRIERFERRSRVAVDRVMMPPHGRCSQAMAQALAAVGFDALCAIHPLPWTAEPPASPLLAAWRPAEFVSGCAVIPRTPLTSTVADLALRAFLGHPMVVYGHHEDVAGGLEPLAEAAERVRRVGGDVTWQSMGEIALGNVERRRDGDRLVVRPYSGRVRVDAEPGVRAVVVEAPEAAGDGPAPRGWSLPGGPVLPFGAEAELLDAGRPVEVRLHAVAQVDPGAIAAPAWRPWPKLRRTGTELRDRALPLRRAA